MTAPAKYVIVAALQREIAGLVKGWQSCRIKGLKNDCWRSGEFVAVVAGMGWEEAFRGTKVAIEAFRPELVTSIGFSGSLSTELPVGSIFIPAQVVGFKNSQSYQTGCGRGTLVTAVGVAGVREKAEIGSRYRAQAVDMEAAAVAEAAAIRGVRFTAIRAISDGAGDEMEFVGAFVTPDGFKTGAFLAHIALRPKLWSALARLASNTAAATRALTAAMQEFLAGPEKFLAESSNQDAPASSPGVGQLAGK